MTAILTTNRPATFCDPVDTVRDALHERYAYDEAVLRRGLRLFERELANCVDELARYDLAAVWLTAIAADVYGGAQ